MVHTSKQWVTCNFPSCFFHSKKSEKYFPGFRRRTFFARPSPLEPGGFEQSQNFGRSYRSNSLPDSSAWRSTTSKGRSGNGLDGGRRRSQNLFIAISFLNPFGLWVPHAATSIPRASVSRRDFYCCFLSQHLFVHLGGFINNLQTLGRRNRCWPVGGCQPE